MANNNDKNIKFYDNLKSEYNKLNDEISKLKLSIETIQNGDDGEPYWNGENAVEMIKNLIKFVNLNEMLLSDIEESINTVNLK